MRRTKRPRLERHCPIVERPLLPPRCRYDARRGLVYGANLAGVVCALKAATGEVVWTWLLKSKYTPLIPVPLGPRISSDFSLLYFGAYDRAFHALHLP